MIKDKRLQMLITAIAVLSGIVAVARYYEGRTTRKTHQRIAAIDEQIKAHQLSKIQRELTDV